MKTSTRHPAAAAIQNHLIQTGTSMRALSRQLGFGDKWVADLLNGRVNDPDPERLNAVAEAIGLRAENLQRPHGGSDPHETRSGPFLNEVIEAVRLAPWDPLERDKVERDINHLCVKWLNRPPMAVPADPKWLRARISRWTAAQLGVSEKRLANVRYSLKKGLNLHIQPLGRAKPARFLKEPWKGLYDQLPKPKKSRRPSRPPLASPRKKTPPDSPAWLAPALSPFLRYCSAIGILPQEVNDETLRNFAEHRKQFDLGDGISRKLTKTRTAWNRAAATILGWPKQLLSEGTKTTEYLKIAFERFPESFRQDIARYKENRGLRVAIPDHGSLLARARAARQAGVDRRGRKIGPLSGSTLRQHIDTLHFYASRLVLLGELALEDITSIGDLIDATLVDFFLTEDIAKRVGLKSQYAGSLAKMIGSIGQRWIPGIDPATLNSISLIRSVAEQNIDRDVMSAKDRERLKPFRSDAEMVRLVGLPKAIFSELESIRLKTGLVTVEMARLAEAAIICLIEQTIPLRRGALVRTHLDHNFVWPLRSNDTALLHYDGEIDKTGKVKQAVLKPWKVRLLRLFLIYYRPVLCADSENRYLFPARENDGHISPGTLAKRSNALIKERLGHTVNMHLWRKIMGCFLLASTENMELVEDLLGHVRGSKATALYAEFKASLAADKLDALLEELVESASEGGINDMVWSD
jgi:transcriptional regulator with XRE-family HTH domain